MLFCLGVLFVSIRRLNAIYAELQQACRVLLGRLVYDIQKGELPARMEAARKLAALLALVRRAERGRIAALPKAMSSVFRRPVLLRMLVEVLKDPSDVIRAEMLAALNTVSLDERVVRLLAPAIEDPSPLVRFRMVELLCGPGQSKDEETIDLLARDADPLVRQMAAAFGIKTHGPEESEEEEPAESP